MCASARRLITLLWQYYTKKEEFFLPVNGHSNQIRRPMAFTSAEPSAVRSEPGEFPVLFVDLDGSLLQTDAFLESFFQTVKAHPSRIIPCSALVAARSGGL